jgi:hypothetical protein
VADEQVSQVSTEQLRAQGRYARQRLRLGWSPSGRAEAREAPDAPDALTSMVETAALARALELVEQASEVPDGLGGDAALGWRAGVAATAALRTAVEYQAGLLPSPPPRLRRDPASPAPVEPAGYRPTGLDWAGGR